MEHSSASESSAELQRVQYKVALLGDPAVGKSSIAARFCRDFFAYEYKQTLGVDFFSRDVLFPDNLEVTFNLFDIGGSSCGSKMLKTYIAGADALVYVYDVTNFASFQSLKQWNENARKICPKAKAVLVGNKSDQIGSREVTKDMVNVMMKELNAFNYFIASALTGDRIQMLFVEIAGTLLGKNLREMAIDQQQSAHVLAPKDNSAQVQLLNEGGSAVGKGIGKDVHKSMAASLASTESAQRLQSYSTAEKKKKRGICRGQ